jgi:hypothetical protein
MNKKPYEVWLRTDEIEEFISGLEFCVELAPVVIEKIMHWKWFILALHNTLQGVCVCALRGQDTAGISMLTKSSAKEVWYWLDVESRKKTHLPMPKEKLASMTELFKRVQKSEILRDPHRFPSNYEITEDVLKLNRLRNDFSHFVPKGFSLEVSGMPRITRHCCDVIEHLAVKYSTFGHHLNGSQRDRITNSLSRLLNKMDEWDKAYHLKQEEVMSDAKLEFDRLSMDLFRVFARFEYALKATGYHNAEGDAKPDWEAFANSIDIDIENPTRSELSEAINYIYNHPPKKQIIRNGKIDWEETENNGNLNKNLILIYVRRVRNNLFHGGKFHGHWVEPVRDYDLLRHSLTILKECLRSSDQVREAYEDGGQYILEGT